MRLEEDEVEFFEVEDSGESGEASPLSQDKNCTSNGTTQAGCTQTGCTQNGCTHYYPCS